MKAQEWYVRVRVRTVPAPTHAQKGTENEEKRGRTKRVVGRGGGAFFFERNRGLNGLYGERKKEEKRAFEKYIFAYSASFFFLKKVEVQKIESFPFFFPFDLMKI